LLGLLRENEGLGARTLASLGVQATEVRDAIARIVGPGAEPVPGRLALTPRAKKVLALAAGEARRLGHAYIGTEHLLLGLLSEGGGIGAQVLLDLGLSLDQIRGEVLRLLAAASPDAKSGLKGTIAEWVDRRHGVRRYSLVLPEQLFQEVQQLADAEQTTVVELLRRFTRLGVLATRAQQEPGGGLFIRERAGDAEQRLLLL